MTRTRPGARLNATEAYSQMSAAIEATACAIKVKEVPLYLLEEYEEVPSRISLYIYGYSPYWLFYRLDDHELAMSKRTILLRFQLNPMLIIDCIQFNSVDPKIDVETLTCIFSSNLLTWLCNVRQCLNVCLISTPCGWYVCRLKSWLDPGSQSSFILSSRYEKSLTLCGRAVADKFTTRSPSLAKPSADSPLVVWMESLASIVKR